MAPWSAVAATTRRLVASDATRGILLLIGTVAALVLANSGVAAGYHAILDARVGVAPGGHGLILTVEAWINEGLMAFFFLLVGLEIKRELLLGDLAERRRAILPAAAAAGGVLVPAGVYVVTALLLGGGSYLRGWGIAIATDIAFAVSVLALMGRRAPRELRVFLTALAIVDDLIAVLVIAVYYTESISLVPLVGASAVFALLLGLNLAGLAWWPPYLLAGSVLWYFMHQSGVHATIAGVLVGAAVPARMAAPGRRPPLQRLERALDPLVTFVVLPLFALANAGIALSWARVAGAIAQPVASGVFLGLVAGKEIGVFLSTLLVVRLGWGALPPNVGWVHVYAAAALGGIGFTMSIFIANLAFPGSENVALAKLAILVASALSALEAFLILWLAPPVGRRLAERRRRRGRGERPEPLPTPP